MTTLPVHFTLGIPGLRSPCEQPDDIVDKRLELEYSYEQGEEIWKYRNSKGAWESIGPSGLTLCSHLIHDDEYCIDLCIHNVSNSGQCFIVCRASGELDICVIVFYVSPQTVGHAPLHAYRTNPPDECVPWHVQARKDPVIKISYRFSGKPPTDEH